MRDVVEREARGLNQDWLDSLIEGFDLIQNRLRRVLKSEGIEPIDCVGHPVDPERMIVIEITEAADWPPQTVIEELRRGYTWRGRILRLAEVKAVRGKPIQEPKNTMTRRMNRSTHANVNESPGVNGSRSAWLETE